MPAKKSPITGRSVKYDLHPNVQDNANGLPTRESIGYDPQCKLAIRQGFAESIWITISIGLVQANDVTVVDVAGQDRETGSSCVTAVGSSNPKHCAATNMIWATTAMQKYSDHDPPVHNFAKHGKSRSRVSRDTRSLCSLTVLPMSRSMGQVEGVHQVNGYNDSGQRSYNAITIYCKVSVAHTNKFEKQMLLS